MAEIIVPSFSASQLLASIEKVDVNVLISSLYPLTDRPPRSEGGFQSNVKEVSPFKVVVGALGCDGIVPATIVKTEDAGL